MNPCLMATLGGVLIGASAVLLMASLGRIAGISGITSGLLAGAAGDRSWRLAFLLGLLIASPLLLLATGANGIGLPQVGRPWMVVAGLLVGVGTSLGNGCTSGHGVCGVAWMSRRSLLATAVFMLCGMATVYVARHFYGGLH